jgi:hypothetical protein
MPHKRKRHKKPSSADQKKIVREYFDFKASARGEKGPSFISDGQLANVRAQLARGKRTGSLTTFEDYLGENLGMWKVRPYGS